MKLPKRWLKYSRSGVIDSTRFVAFKVPLPKRRHPHLDPAHWFTPQDLLTMYPDIGLVIDLTFKASGFYCKTTEFLDKQIEHVKVISQGHVVPSDAKFNTFANVVDDFIRRHPDRLIGVHCTHGVNRTGYYICRYMIERLDIPPDKAIKMFESGRGHRIERVNYTNDLLKRMKQTSPCRKRREDGKREEGEEDKDDGWTVVRQRKRRIKN